MLSPEESEGNPHAVDKERGILFNRDLVVVGHHLGVIHDCPVIRALSLVVSLITLDGT